MTADVHAHDTVRPPLTQRQTQVLTAIVDNLALHGCPPTIRELAGELGLRSTNGVASHLAALERKGYLEKRANKSRTWRPVAARAPPAKTRPPGGQARPRLVPLVGRVAAGLPALAIEQAEEWVSIDAHFLPRACRDVFALRIVGESMCEAGIGPEDIVVVERRDHADAGAIVVALLGDEATIKRYRPDPKTHSVRLEPANAAMSAIVLTAAEAAALRIIGVVVGVWRSL